YLGDQYDWSWDKVSMIPPSSQLGRTYVGYEDGANYPNYYSTVGYVICALENSTILKDSSWTSWYHTVGRDTLNKGTAVFISTYDFDRSSINNMITASKPISVFA